MDDFKNLINIFEYSNKEFIDKNMIILENKASERCICASLSQTILNNLKNSKYHEYYVDVEYNRNYGGVKKTINGPENINIEITCDLIVHSRGEIENKDNLITLEMKKSYREKKEKEKDKFRLQEMTRPLDETMTRINGTRFPENVCGYILGVYYEIDLNKRMILIEYYKNAKLFNYYKFEY